MGPMSEEDRQEFMAGLHVGVIGIADDDRGPLTIPVWYSYEPGGDVIVLMARDSRKGRLIEESGRFSMCAQQEELPYKYVMAEGPVTATRDATYDDTLAMATRYLGDELGKGYADSMASDSSSVYSMTPQRWYSTDYSG
ncbi:MAG: pyridoxamine 5'-phosphate oxidase [Actinomycetia bacterium]|nr:pyridoxamine 5'-phosphate oxidase [Actinomycetes bacterium]MCP4960555.1 pyridoxamine 5'-phosphate oxidase [Actinomycetes bacterium]